MKFALILVMLFAFNAEASDAPKADDKKAPERSAVPEKITRPKAKPDDLPQPVAKNSNPDACPKFEYKEKPAKLCACKKRWGPTSPSLQRIEP